MQPFNSTEGMSTEGLQWNNISYSDKYVASNVNDNIVNTFWYHMCGFDQMNVICISQGTVATFTGEVDTFIIIWCDVSSGFHVLKITEIGSFFIELFFKKIRSRCFFWNTV